jgi:phosphoribosylanthranilate isomerase
MNVKVCGITSAADARMALEEGADAVGVIVDVPVQTSRKVNIDLAAQIRDSVSDMSCAFIAVTMPKTVEEAEKVCVKVRPDGIQLHGEETPEFLSKLRGRVGCRIIKAIHIDNDIDMEYVKAVSEEADMLLLDTKTGSKVGGTGMTHDYSIDARIKKLTGSRIMLSGGLNAENVAAAVDAVKPYAVDVSSGVESKPAVKDRGKVRRFIEVTRCL